MNKDSLEKIRNQLSAEAVEVVSAILDYFLKNDEWIPVRALHIQFGGKEKATRILDNLGGSIVFLRSNGGLSRYQLTLLGVLLSDKGEELLSLICQYLKFAKLKAFEGPKRTHIHSREVAGGINASEYQIRTLGWLLRYGWLSSGGNFSKDKWNAGLPRNIEDIPDSPLEFVSDKIAANYKSGMPINPLARGSKRVIHSDAEVQPTFRYIQNEKLRQQISEDWNEALIAFEAGAWKSTIVLCGGLLEGMLIDALSSKETQAKETYRELMGKSSGQNPRSWRLVDLVDVSSRMGLIGRSSAHLSHAIRHYRNLIHPIRHISEEVKVSKESASIALDTIRIFIWEFESRAKF